MAVTLGVCPPPPLAPICLRAVVVPACPIGEVHNFIDEYFANSGWSRSANRRCSQ